MNIDQLLNMSRAERRRLENLHNLELAQRIGQPCESDSKVYEAERDLQLQQNRWQNEKV